MAGDGSRIASGLKLAIGLFVSLPVSLIPPAASAGCRVGARASGARQGRCGDVTPRMPRITKQGTLQPRTRPRVQKRLEPRVRPRVAPRIEPRMQERSD